MPKKKTNEQPAENYFFVIGIGASAGGLDALRAFVKTIPPDSGMAFIFIQHLHPDFESSMPAIIQRETKIPVMEITNGTKVMPNHIFIPPANKSLTVVNGSLKLTAHNVNVKHDYHPIDHFFASLAEEYQSNAIGVVLSGLGTDGTAGLKKIKDFGGITFAQDADSAGFNSMPMHAINAGLVDFVMEPSQIPSQLVNLDNALRNIPIEDSPTEKMREEDDFRQILALLRARRGVDFTYYKQSTIRRRILRRMLINKIDNLGIYLEQLRGSKAEQDILYQDLLIPVTSFFRDTETFSHLCEGVLPELIKNKSASNPLRIWVAGCSTGEEAYSIGICLYEYLGEKLSAFKVQIFATDVSEKAIIKARSGIYNKRELESVSEERLQEFFHKVDGSYQVKKMIRDMCVFACHNFLKDPPFAKIDLVSCRNVLIYMEGYLQKKAFGTFHYALNEKGMLLLGKSETTGNSNELFTSASKQDKLYIKKQAPTQVANFNTERKEKPFTENEVINQTEKRKNDFQRNADDILLSRFSPAGVVLNEQFDIVQFRGATGDFLEAVPGKASLNIFKMVRDGMAFEIRSALHKAKLTNEPVAKDDILIKEGTQLINIEVIPLLNTIEPYYLVLFRGNEKQSGSKLPAGDKKNKIDPKIKKTADELRIKQLEKDLSQLRDDMHSITEDQEAANEELQSANEELLSGSEELQSLNEELETSKEELQSTNEELMTINDELLERSEQYNQARLYTDTIVRTIHEPILVLNKDLRIKTANQSFYKAFHLKEEEITGRIIFELQERTWDMPGLRTALSTIQSGDQKYIEYEMTFPAALENLRIFLMIAQYIEGPANEPMILVALDDITLRKKEIEILKLSAEEIKKEQQVLERFFMQASAGFCILDGPDHKFRFANPAYTSMFGVKDLKGKYFSDAYKGGKRITEIETIDRVYKTGEPVISTEIPIEINNNKIVYLDFNYQPLKNEFGKTDGVLVFFYDVTEKMNRRLQWMQQAEEFERQVIERTSTLKELNANLLHSNKSLEQFASIASHDLQEPLRKLQTFINILVNKYRESLPDKAKELVEKIDTAALRMSTLVRDILNYSRLTRTEAEFTLINLNQVLQNVLKDHEFIIREKNAAIHFDQLPLIEAIPHQMNQLFDNLLANSLKFSKEKDVVISINYRQPDDTDIRKHASLNPDLKYGEIIFRDNGIGFDPEFSEQIFLIFQRLNNVAKYPGTGIGLALCRNIAFTHRGVIWAESDKGTETSFHLILPLKQS